MSFWITVVQPENEDKMLSPNMIPAVGTVDEDTWLTALHEWEEQRGKFILYEGPLGADGTVGEFWSGVAHKVGLPMLASIYNEGLRLESPDEISQYEKELQTLQEY